MTRYEKLVRNEQTKMAMNSLRKMSLEQLVGRFELTSKMEASVELAMVRGWLMDAIEERNPEGYNRWIENSDEDDVRAYVL